LQNTRNSATPRSILSTRRHNESAYTADINSANHKKGSSVHENLQNQKKLEQEAEQIEQELNTKKEKLNEIIKLSEANGTPPADDPAINRLQIEI
jgi:DNA-directed RNA polymerase specialized sigma subunit